MAASARAITPTLTGAFSAANAPNTPSPLGPNAAKDLQSHPSLNSQHSGTFGAQLTKSPKGLSPTLSPQPLTGAAAMADERRLREQEKSRQTSPNPAIAVVQNLLGAANQTAMSRLKDAPPEPAQMSEPIAKAAKSIVIPDQVTVENMQTSPVSLSSFGSAESTAAPTATAIDAPAGPILSSMPGQDAPTPQQHQPIAPNPGDTPNNRAFTFPGPLSEHDPRAPSRQMSLPGYNNSPRSPSTKRHKCPYCSTDFTRHHNLKSHLLTHSQEKPYECPTCNARFRRLHDLKRHTKLHTGERPHTCDKCGRKFARGDALARHNKGQGGCAGRRSSFGVDDDMADAKGDDSMDGVVYGDDGEERMDDDDQDREGRRRVSEPARKRQNTGNSTQAPSSLSSLHFAANQSGVFGQSGMTESPKPLSPGQAEHQRLGMSEGSLPGTRSPNMMHQQSFSRGAGRGSSPMGMHHPHGTNSVPQLPSLPGLTPMNVHGKGSQGGSKNNGPSMLQHQQVPGTTSQPGSISSHGGSGGSMREVMGGRDVDVWQFIRDLENRMAQSNAENEKKISQLTDEITTLRAQLAQQQGAAPQQNH